MLQFVQALATSMALMAQVIVAHLGALTALRKVLPTRPWG